MSDVQESMKEEEKVDDVHQSYIISEEEKVDPELEKRVLRKLDLLLLPFLGITYGLQFLDKTTLGYSAVFGIIVDNNLVGQQYSWCSSLFYFGYLFFQYIGTLFLLPRFPIGKFLGVMIFLWGCLLIAFIGCNSFAKLGALRFLLGCLEAVISPCFMMLMSLFYPKRAHSSRSAVWISCNGLFGMFGGVLTYGIGHIHSGPYPESQWKYIYLILGSITAAWGIFFFLYVPSSPKTARFLTPDEREAAIKIVASNNMGLKTNEIKLYQIKEALLDINCWLMLLVCFCNSVPSGGLSTFGSIIIQGFGFTTLQTTLMNIPLSGILWAACLVYGFVTTSTPLRKYRLLTAATFMILPIIGTGLIHGLTGKWGRLVGIWLLGIFVIGFVSCLSTAVSNVAGTTKKATAAFMIFIGYSVGQIAGPQVMKANQAPKYTGGVVAMLITLILNLVFIVCLHFSYTYENKKRDSKYGKLTETQIEQAKINGFEDQTDKENIYFRYAL